MTKLLIIALAVVVVGAVAYVTVHADDRQTMPSVGLYFYPKDMTSGCTIEAHNFQRDQAQFDARNAIILGVSVDTPDSHKQFCTKEGLTFRLLADPNHTVVDAYGSLGNYAGFKIANRNTFLIDPQGNIAKVWTKVQVQHHSEEVLAALDQLKK